MNAKDRWSAHLEYLKVAITLSTAILTVSAAIYSDPAKIPTGGSKYILLVCAVFVLSTLISSIVAIINLCNLLIVSKENTSSDQSEIQIAAKITIGSGASFFSLILAGVFLLVFFFVRSF